MTQGTLDFVPHPDDVLDAAFDRYDRANPEVWLLFRRFTFEVINSGRTRYSARAIAHRIRWHSTIETTGPKADGFKLANAHVRRYALRFARLYPEHASFFQFVEPRR